MVIREYRVPDAAEGVLCDPPLADWERTVQTNRAQASTWEFSILGVSAGKLRRWARRRLWGRPDTDPVIVTGHQPVFFHAGVWIKALAVRRAVAAMGDAAGYHVNVDSDEVSDLGLWLPYGGPQAPSPEGKGEPGALSLARRWLSLGGPSSLPLERRPVPSREEWDAFAREGEALLASLPCPSEREALLERWRTFAEIGRRERDRVAAEGPAGNLARFMAAARRGFEATLGDSAETPGSPAAGEPFLWETYVSSISETPEFYLFALGWMAEAERLAALYNEQLALYRRLRRYRTRVNPFPDLRRYGRQIEVPFWCAGPRGERADLFVIPEEEGRVLSLTTRHGERARIDVGDPEGAVAALDRAGLRLRPKAVPLTLFLRMFASDLFVHGVGGGRYDHITDGIIRGWFRVDPPVYAVVSASLPLLPPRSRAEAEREDGVVYWKQQVRALKFNPQRFVPDGPGADGGSPGEVPRAPGDPEHLQRLKAEKEELIRAIQEPGAAKRALTRRIEAVNEALSRALGPVHDEVAARLADARRREQEQAVACARDYPFFLHHWETLWKALDRG